MDKNNVENDITVIAIEKVRPLLDYLDAKEYDYIWSKDHYEKVLCNSEDKNWPSLAEYYSMLLEMAISLIPVSIINKLRSR